jgi:translocation and assembly module TamA
VSSADGRIAGACAQRGYPYAKVLNRKVVVDRATKTMSVTYTADPGPAATFGDVAIDGLKDLGEDYVRHRIRWNRGASYDLRLVEETRKRLIDSGLFSSVKIDHAAKLAADGSVPMSIHLVERRRHSVGAGLAYNTSEGFGANAFWEDRNLFGEAERLHVDVDLAQQTRDIRAIFRKPDFLQPQQDLIGLAEFVDENPIAYTARHELVAAGLERHYGDHYTVGAELQAQQAMTTEAARDITDTYALLGVPLSPSFMRTRSTTLGPPLANWAAASAISNPSNGVNWVASRPNSNWLRISSCG